MVLLHWKACSFASLGSFLAVMFITMFRNPGRKPELIIPQARQASRDAERARIQKKEEEAAEVEDSDSEEDEQLGQAPRISDYLKFNRKKPYEEKENYRQTYAKLYAKGYHPDLTHSSERMVVKFLVSFDEKIRLAGRERIKRVVVLGCSHGLGTWQLFTNGYTVWGVDVSSQAIDMATKTRGRTCGPGDEPCFIRASLTNLPFDDGHFDAGVSADVFEHLMPEDVPRLVAEISRVVRHSLFLQISIGPDTTTKPKEDLHRTQRGPKWWREKFEKVGWRVHRDESKTGIKDGVDVGVVRLVLIRNPW